LAASTAQAPQSALPPVTGRFLALVAVFVACLVVSNVIAGKIVAFGALNLSAALIVFPVTYIIGDIMTEVYGFRRARQVIWLGFLGNIVAVAAILVAIEMPPADFYGDQDSYALILGQTPRILAASLAAYLVGEFVNSYLLAKMKLWTAGRHLWTRTIGSTLVGQGFDTTIFTVLAFAGVFPVEAILVIVATEWAIKCLYEAAMTPVTYGVVGWLKRAEGIDVYDRGTRFNPFAVTE
jgi:uncharacterized integral membrane protein (TIGR00697 family)